MAFAAKYTAAILPYWYLSSFYASAEAVSHSLYCNYCYPGCHACCRRFRGWHFACFEEFSQQQSKCSSINWKLFLNRRLNRYTKTGTVAYTCGAWHGALSG